MGFGARLREERQKTGLNQEQLGRIGGVGRNAQNEYESDKGSPKADYLARLGDHGVDIGYVLTGSRATDSLSPELSEVVGMLAQLPSGWTSVVRQTLSQALASIGTSEPGSSNER